MAYEVRVVGNNSYAGHGRRYKCIVTMPDGREKEYFAQGNINADHAMRACVQEAMSDVEFGRYTLREPEPKEHKGSSGAGGSSEPKEKFNPRDIDKNND